MREWRRGAPPRETEKLNGREWRMEGVIRDKTSKKFSK
jgi:hypothetical protein